MLSSISRLKSFFNKLRINFFVFSSLALNGHKRGDNIHKTPPGGISGTLRDGEPRSPPVGNSGMLRVGEPTLMLTGMVTLGN